MLLSVASFFVVVAHDELPDPRSKDVVPAVASIKSATPPIGFTTRLILFELLIMLLLLPYILGGLDVRIDNSLNNFFILASNTCFCKAISNANSSKVPNTKMTQNTIHTSSLELQNERGIKFKLSGTSKSNL